MSNSLDPDQARHFVRPDLDPNCLQSLSAEQKVAASGQRVKYRTTSWYYFFRLKPWLKSISYGFNFFHLAKVLATTNSEPGLALVR